MRCEKCHDNLANVRFNLRTNFESEELNLCLDCYKKVKNEFKIPSPFPNIFDNSSNNHFSSVKTKEKPKKVGILDQLGKNLNNLALEGKIDPVIGRHIEIEQVIETLNRRNKNNPVLIGEPGVGKTAIAEGLALQIVEGNVSSKLANKEVYLLDLSSIVAGTGIRGQFEERMQRIIKELEEREEVILFIDEIHLLVGAGSAEGSMDAGNILKPSLARGNIQIIGATTLKEYRQIEKDAALERRFQPIIVNEPSAEDTIAILKGLRSKYENYHHVRYPDEVIEACVVLSKRYIQDRQLPDKAIDLLDIAGSKLNLKTGKNPQSFENLQAQWKQIKHEKEKATLNEEYETAANLRDQEVKLLKKLEEEQKGTKDTEVSVVDIEAIIEKMTKIPVSKLQSEEQQKMNYLKENLAKQIIGQPEAVEKVTKAIRRSCAGLKPKNRPTASFLFVGPTGVGKTELAKVLAQEIFGSRDAMIRLDMSEFMEKHSVSKLIGSPPGYVGFDEAGQLTEKIRRNPYSLLLLDELEKAHPDVQNMFLQILEDGHLTDSQGRKVNFKETVIIATSNAGSNAKAKPSLGFNSSTEKETSVISSLKDTFRPEFLNRFDNIISFNVLEKEHLVQIINLLLADVTSTLKEKNILLEVTQEAKEMIANIGYDGEFGARPLRRAIQEQIEDSVTDLILEQSSISHIFVGVKDQKIVVEQK